jgi:hypothetical protein
MERYQADKVELFADVDYGEGGIAFRWPDPRFGWECLKIDLDGHCARRMPIHSGSGIDSIELHRDRIRFRFAPPLARALQFEEEIEIAFSTSDEDFRALRKVIVYLMGEEDDSMAEDTPVNRQTSENC